MSSPVELAFSSNSYIYWYILKQFLFYSDDCCKLGYVMMKDV